MRMPAAGQHNNRPLDSMADVVDALAIEFGPIIEKATLVRVARHCRRELAIAGCASVDVLHARARGRLRDLVTAGTHVPTHDRHIYK